MIRTIFFLIALYFSTAPLLPQELSADSLKLNLRLLSEPLYDLSYPDFHIEGLEENLTFPNLQDSSSVWLFTSYSINNFGRSGFRFNEGQAHILSSYHKMYLENSKFNTVRYVLGMAQLGAVGYLAYKSIKKHGFWNNK